MTTQEPTDTSSVIPQRILDEVDAVSIAAQGQATAGINGWTAAGLAELDVPELVLLDGPLGLVSRHMDERDVATVYPSGTSLAATWDVNLVRRVAGELGAEARDHGVDVVLGPNLNLPRTAFSGRSFEMFSEDPHLTAAIGAGWIRGVQDHGVAACAKHLVANDTETRRQTMNSEVGDVALREIYLVPFEQAAAVGVWTMLTAYNRFRGVHCSENAELLQIIKEEWGYDGVVMSDWFATKDTVASAQAGLDLEMPGPARFFGSAFAQAVENGEVSRERLADAAARVVLLAERTGARQRHRSGQAAAVDGRRSELDRDVLREAAAAGTVLLRNADDTLPLTPGRQRLTAVIGPNATRPCYQGGTFARVNTVPDIISPLQALREAFGSDRIVHSVGCAPTGPLPLNELNPTAPDGSPGLLLEYFAPDSANPTASEVRPGSTFVWFGDIPGIGTPAVGGHLRLTCDLSASVSGSYELHVGGTGSAVLQLDGQVVCEWASPDPVDIMGVVARADTNGAQVALDSARTHRLVAEFDLVPGRVQSVTLAQRPPTPPDLLQEAVAIATAADEVVLVLGDDRNSSRESADRTTTELPAPQLELLHAVAAANPRTVVVLNVGHQVDTSWAEEVAAILVPWYAGQEFGPALADVLSGRREPGGRLPVTFAQRDADYPGFGVQLDSDQSLDYGSIEPAGAEHFAAAGITPAFPLGAGSGYTSWQLLTAELVDGPGGDRTYISGTMANTGQRAGSDVVQLYARASGESAERLVDFVRVHAGPGESTSFVLEVTPTSLRRWNESAGDWYTPSGAHTMTVARHAADPSGLALEFTPRL